ncbi:MAG: LUD domain-containing protein [Pseudomonadota bacterium]
MSARDRILAAASSKLGDAESRKAAVDARLSAGRQTSLKPEIALTDGAERVERFIAQAEAVQATVSRHAAVSELPAALSDQLRNRNLPQAVRTGSAPDFAGLDWGGVEVSQGKGRVDEPATLSRAFCAAAETGTLALTSGPENPVTLTFLGETHFVVLKASEIEAGYEGVWDRFRKSGRDPRTLNLVTGPSRTADIEQKLELGAHGPVALHIFLLND